MGGVPCADAAADLRIVAEEAATTAYLLGWGMIFLRQGIGAPALVNHDW